MFYVCLCFVDTFTGTAPRVNRGLSGGAIAGIVIGVILGIVLILGIGYLVIRTPEPVKNFVNSAQERFQRRSETGNPGFATQFDNPNSSST